MSLANQKIKVHLRVRVPRGRVNPEHLTGHRIVEAVEHQVPWVGGGVSDELLDEKLTN